ncbi:MAG: DNA-directed DNA polymerase [Candidatus Pacearchaeota archaeon]
MIKTSFIPVEYDYFDFNGKNYIKIIGRDNEGKRTCILDSCDIYLWAILKEDTKKERINPLVKKIEKIKLDIKGRKTKVEKVEVHDKNFLGKKVKSLKIYATNYKDLHDIANELDFPEIEKRRGYDLGFITHYIIEKKIIPFNWYEIEGEIAGGEFQGIENLDVEKCIVLHSAKKTDDKKFNPKVLAYDIETDDIKIGEGEIVMLSLVSKSFKKVLTWKKTSGKKPDYVEYVKDEAELIEKFVENVREFSPDFLIGYFSDGFDLPYLRARANKLNVRLSLGLDDSQPKMLRGGKGINFTGKISGIVHIDLIRFIQTAYSQYMQSETLSLNEVSKEFLGDTKKEFKPKSSEKIKDHNWKEYYEYNLHDSVLVLGLFEKMWPDILEFTRIMQEPVFDVTRNGMSSNVEDYIIHNLERFNEIPEKRPTHDEIGKRRSSGKYEGAFVFEPKPGMYENISIFDFTSSYGTTIVTYNLSKSTFLEKKLSNTPTYSIDIQDKKVYFTKKPGFFPEMLREIIEKRKKYKQELKKEPDVIKKARSNAFKLLANASYGYQGFFGARYYQREAAAATAAFAKKLIKEAIENINKSGYEVIYSDTDSIAFQMKEKTEKQTLEFLNKLNSKLPGIMELELEGFFKRGIWVTKRTGTIGAKKKYALISKDNKLKIRGFETVRRDWCALARKVQNEVIKKVLEDGNEKRAMEYVKKIIKKIKQREVNREDLIIKTMLKKPLSEYKAISPHVIAARKMKEKEIPASNGNLIEYYISETDNKKALVRERVKLPEEPGNYDIKYYLERQILPAVENIFQLFNINTQEHIEGKKQTKLGDF